MLFRRLDLSSVSHAWNRDESKHNGRGWRRAWKTRLLLRAAVAAGYTDAPRNRANIGAAEFSPYIHHFSALWIKRRLVYSFEEVFFFFFLLYACLNKQLRLIYSSLVFYQFQHFFGLHTRLDWRSCAWLIMLNSNIISPVFTASSWNWGYQKVLKKTTWRCLQSGRNTWLGVPSGICALCDVTKCRETFWKEEHIKNGNEGLFFLCSQFKWKPKLVWLVPFFFLSFFLTSAASQKPSRQHLTLKGNESSRPFPG